ncbi:MAG: hypothetical protein HY648_09485 [Acidobacteria bacterium]|nr:hypothetical protein [Acidobacteriota bacterium]
MRSEKLLLARGAAEVSARPRLDVLVPLAEDADEEVRQAALQTLDRLEDDYYARALASPALSQTALRYFLDPARLRPGLLPVLLANPAAPQDAIEALAATAGPDVIPHLLEHLDLLKTPALAALKRNPAYLQLKKRSSVGALPQEEKIAVARDFQNLPAGEQLPTLVLLAADADEEVRQAAEAVLGGIEETRLAALLAEAYLEESVARYFLEPSRIRAALLPLVLANPAAPPDAVAALAAQAGTEIIPVLLDNIDLLRTQTLVALKNNPAYLDWQKEPPAQGIVVEVDLLEMLIAEAEAEELQEFHAELTQEEEKEKEGPYSKISKMGVAQRVKLALLGNREERGLLIRDSSRSVCRAVLSSPKLTDTEVESFSAMKNISQEVLRLIAMNRKFMKNYTVVKNLVNNPRLPIDVGLPLLHRLIVNDLYGVSRSKEVPDVIRKMAEKLYKNRRS